MSTHTPGPWAYTYTSAQQARAEAYMCGEFNDGGGADGSIYQGKGLSKKTIAFLPHHRDAREDEERQQNAALLAAAPELLGALKDYQAYFESMSGHPCNSVSRRAKQVIAKAEGRAEQ